MKKHILSIASFIFLIGIMSCESKSGSQPKVQTNEDSLKTETNERDSTIYGISDEFGMSTFTLITNEGDTICVTRTSENGIDGNIYGELKEGKKYALTTGDDNQSISTLINLSQLEQYTTNYSICNGKLVLQDQEGDADTVQILELSKNSFKAQGKKEYNFNK